MTTELHERLADLASVAPPASPPPDLWTRGVRRRRLAAAGRTAMVAVLVLMIGAGGWAWHQTRPIEPADTNGTSHLPDRLYDPSPWLSSFGGPPGRLVALLPAERKSLFHTSPGLVGVTASTGQYGFLDLPSNAVADASRPASPPSLSPDGRHVAFWTTGTPSGTPNTHLIGVTITGVGVYDTETGHVESAPLTTVHGLNPELLSWTSNHTLVLGLAQDSYGDQNPNSCCEGHWDGLATWDIDGGNGPITLTNRMPSFVSVDVTSAGGGLLVWSDGGHRIHLIDPRPPGRDQRYQLPRDTDYAVLSPDRRRLALVSNPRRGRLLVGSVPRRERQQAPEVRLRPATSEAGFVRVVAWQDDDHVVVERRIEERLRAAYRLEVVEVSTGRAQVLVKQARSDDERDPTGSEFARGMLTAPIVHASAPPRPSDRRWVLGGSLAVILVAGLSLWGVTRGRRA